jgi:general secretion pathway protein D
MKKLIFILFIALSIFANANECNNKFFSYSNSINQNERMSIKSFLDLLVTQKCGINIVYDDNIAKQVIKGKMPYLRINNYTLRHILDLILTQRSLFYTLNNNTLSISYYKTKAYKINFISSTRSGLSNITSMDNRIENTYVFDFWGKIKDQIKNLLKSNFTIDPNYFLLKKYNYKVFAPVVDKNSGIVMVTGTMKQIKAVDEYVKSLMNSLTKEVLIDVKIYTVELSESHKTGIDWTRLNISLNGASVPVNHIGHKVFGKQSVFNAANFNIQGFLNFLAKNGNVNSISSPKIMTLNNQKAIIRAGDTIYYSYVSKVSVDKNGNANNVHTIASKFVGVVLDITPQISDNGNIILSISTTLNNFRDPTQVSQSSDRTMPPDTRDNTMFSIVKLKDNDTLVLGGLITKDNTLNVNGVPVLKEIPLIKYLFSSREKITNRKELVFVITPHIIDFSKKKTLRDLGFGRIK